MKLIDTILHKMSRMSTPQRKFLVTLWTTIQLVRGKMTFRNLSRSRDLHEKTSARHFRTVFDFPSCHPLALTTLLPAGTTKIGVIDGTVISKSGKRTDGLALFSHSSHGRPEKGLEFSELAVVDVDYGTAYHLSMEQTPETATLTKLLGPEETRIDWDLSHLWREGSLFPSEVDSLAADGYDAKQKFVDGVREFGLHLISKLRHEAHLRHLSPGPQQRRGRPKRDDGNVKLTDLRRLTPIPLSEELTLYTAIVNSVSLHRDIRIVSVCKRQGTKRLTALLFSTEMTLAAEDISRYYTARFQIEFLFRDATQFTGLADVQVRAQRRLEFHVNASMTALNFLKLEDRQMFPDDDDHVISINSWKLRKFNEHQLERVISTLGLDLSDIKLHPHYEDLMNYGAIAA